jgi:hypothetical protein
MYMYINIHICLHIYPFLFLGRAAQMGILALMVHERLNNDPYIINSLLGSPIPFNQ